MTTDTCVIKTAKDKRELVAHGSEEFPLAIYNYSGSDNTPLDIVPWHWHEEFEVLYIKRGSAVLQIPGEEVVLGEGETAVINANTLHYIKGNPFLILQSMVFSPLLIAGDKRSAIFKRYINPIITSPFSLELSSSNEDAVLFENAYNAARDESEEYEFKVRENLSFLILSLYRKEKDKLDSAGNTQNRDLDRIERMMAYINRSYKNPIALSDIASSAALSTRETLRCFKRTIGESPMQYLMKYRLMKSADLLIEERGMSISDIALLSGFEDPSYYSMLFKRFYRCSPKEYRKKREETQ